MFYVPAHYFRESTTKSMQTSKTGCGILFLFLLWAFAVTQRENGKMSEKHFWKNIRNNFKYKFNLIFSQLKYDLSLI